jgi:hypothetical protein
MAIILNPLGFLKNWFSSCICQFLLVKCSWEIKLSGACSSGSWERKRYEVRKRQIIINKLEANDRRFLHSKAMLYGIANGRYINSRTRRE